MATFRILKQFDANGREVKIDDKPFDEKIDHVRAWYDRHVRIWTIEKYNADDYQVGTTEYAATKAEALAIKAEIEAAAGIK